MNEEYYLKFPSVFKEKLKSGVIKFPSDTKFQYESKIAYRCIVRKENDNAPVNRSDFKSYAELGKTKAPRGLGYDTCSPNYYGCSLYLNKSLVENALKLPKPGKRIAKVCVKQEGGAIQINLDTQHVCWWLFEAYNKFEASIE